jgi:hypothetical protein
MKKQTYLLWLLLAAIVQGSYSQIQPPKRVDPHFYGLNFHSTYYADPNDYRDFSTDDWNLIKESGAKFMRAGGKQYNLDANRMPANTVRYVDLVDAIRAKGFEPIITAPFNGNVGTTALKEQADYAADIVRQLNVVHKRNVKYYIIGNEPDLDFPSLSSAQVAKYIRAISAAMKAVDPTIKIIGPDLKTYYESYNYGNDFLSAPSSSYPNNDNDPSIAGKIPGTNLFHIDYFSFHIYPQGLDSYDDIKNYPTNSFRPRLQFLKNRIEGLPDRDLTNLKVIINEFNITTSYSNSPNDIKLQNVNGLNSPNSFIAGQWMADMMLEAIASGVVSMVNPWSTKERGLRPPPTTTNYDYLGILHGTSGEPKPTYWHYQMLANFFNGTVYSNTNSNLNPNVKTYLSMNAHSVVIMVMNYGSTDINNFYFDFWDHNNPTDNSAVFDLNNSGGYAFMEPLRKESTYLFYFTDCNNLNNPPEEIFVLSKEDINNAIANNTYASYNYASPYTASWYRHVVAINNPPASSPACMGTNATNVYVTGGPNITYYKLPERVQISNPNNLGAGLYEAVVLNDCDEESIVFSVNEKSSLIDPGKNTCGSSMGNADLPSNINYSWSPSIDCGTPNCSYGTTTCTTVTSYTMTAQGGTCPTSCEVIVTPQKELMIKDNWSDVGLQPNNSTDAHWRSVDIWVRRQPDFDPIHQNPKGGQDNYVYVRIRNIGCSSILADDITMDLKYVNYSSMTPNQQHSIDAPPTLGFTVINPGEEKVIEFLWPDHKVPDGIGTSQHACLLATTSILLEDEVKPGSDASADNNRAHKNVTVIGSDQAGIAPPSGGGVVEVVNCVKFEMGNVTNQPVTTSLDVYQNFEINPQLFVEGGRMELNLGEEVYRKWIEGGRKGEGITPGKFTNMSATGILHHHSPHHYPNAGTESPYTLTMTAGTATIANLAFAPMEIQEVEVCFLFAKEIAQQFFEYDIRQTDNGFVTGGVGFDVYVPDCVIPDAGVDVTIGKKCSATLTASPVIAGAVYKWRNSKTGEYLGSGQSITVSPYQTTTYELEMQSPNGCIDYDNVTVTVNNNASCNPTCGKPDFVNEIINKPRTISGEELSVSGTLRVGAKGSLRLENTKLNFRENAMIEVMPGGRLEIIDSELRSCDALEKWKGIIIRGRKNERENIRIEGSTFSEAAVAVRAEDIAGLTMRGNKFIEGTTAIELIGTKDFAISENRFYSNQTAIRTTGSLNTSEASSVEGNFFAENKRAMEFINDNHSTLRISCNSFVDYTDYAVYSQSSTLSDQGNETAGAGNYFISSSSQFNHQLYHRGNNMKYFTDPAHSFSLTAVNGTTAQAIPSTEDGTCTPVNSARMASITETAESTEGKEIAMTVSEMAMTKLKLEAVPNPATEKVNIRFSTEINKPMQLVILNLMGQLVEKREIIGQTGAVDLDISAYPSGMYYYGLISGGEVIAVKKLVITK